MAKILVTGINGFVGKHMARELRSQNHDVIGLGHDPEYHKELEGIISGYFTCDLTDKSKVAELPLDDIDSVISLAGLAKVGESFSKAELYQNVNVAVLSVIGERLLTIKSTARVIAVSTGAVYSADQPMPLSEESGLITTGSPYALSKVAMEKSAVDLRSRGLDCVIVRPFNHIGPGQEQGTLVPDIYYQIKLASKTDGVLKVGDLTTQRDFTDVRDVVKAYAGLATKESLEFDLYNVCTGHSVETKRIVDLLIKETGHMGNITLQTDPQLIRPTDPKILFGNNGRLLQTLNWRPTISLEQTIKDFVSAG
jgi:GDP-4-dehydro-6-deoxy-D-mannose reductase